MIDFSKFNYSCENQMTFEECIQEIEKYKWETGQYMNLPEMEETDNEDNRLHTGRKRKRNFPK